MWPRFPFWLMTSGMSRAQYGLHQLIIANYEKSLYIMIYIFVALYLLNGWDLSCISTNQCCGYNYTQCSIRFQRLWFLIFFFLHIFKGIRLNFSNWPSFWYWRAAHFSSFGFYAVIGVWKVCSLYGLVKFRTHNWFLNQAQGPNNALLYFKKH